jgi:hypothetical protein
VKDKPEQLDIFAELEAKKRAEEPYYNALNEPLPWETEEYIKSLEKENYE